MNLIQILKIKIQSSYVLEISFADGKKTVIDFEPFLTQSQHPEIRKYLDVELFSQFKIEDSDLMWGDFDMMFPIDELYSEAFSQRYTWNQSA